jgi:hypothetical protein
MKKSIMFICGEKDTMISKEHSELLYTKFKGYK